MLSDLFKKRNKGSEQVITALFEAPATKHKQQPKQAEEVDIEEHPAETEHEKQQKLQRTIFVGNIPINTKHKTIKKEFEKYGPVDKVWFRSAPVESNKMGPKASFILKKFQDTADAMNAYVRFMDEASVDEALQMNGKQMGDLTIRVTRANQKQQDFQSTIFVGNLPFAATEEQLRRFCQSVGTIVNIRLLRNPTTHQGIGIAYVRYDTKQTMKRAIKELNGKEFESRQLRVKKAVEKKKLEKKARKIAEKHKVQNANQQNAEKRLKEKKVKESIQSKKDQKKEEKKQQRPEKKQGKTQEKEKYKAKLSKASIVPVSKQTDENELELQRQVAKQWSVLRQKPIKKQ